MSLTKKEWEAKWEEQFKTLRAQFPNASLQTIQLAARRWVANTYGDPVDDPKEEVDVPARLKLLSLFSGGKMATFVKLVSRFGPLIAAFCVGLVGVVPGADEILQGVVQAFSLLGIKPDSQTAAEFGNIVAASLLLYGSKNLRLSVSPRTDATILVGAKYAPFSSPFGIPQYPLSSYPCSLC